MGYVKLFSDILASTVWAEPNNVRIVWITMLAMADRDGLVMASVPGLAHIARVGLQDAESALATLESPDAHSRTREHEGRRIEPIPGGWRVLNYEAHRERATADDMRAKAAARQRRKYHRDKEREVREVEREITPAYGGGGGGASGDGCTTTQKENQKEKPKTKGGGGGVGGWVKLRDVLVNETALQSFRPERAGILDGVAMQLAERGVTVEQLRQIIAACSSKKNPAGFLYTVLTKETWDGLLDAEVSRG